MTLDEAKKIIKSECYIADLLNLDRTQMVNTALDTVIEAAERYATMYEKVVACNTSEREDYSPYQHIQHIEVPFDIMRGTFDVEKGILTIEPPYKAEGSDEE